MDWVIAAMLVAFGMLLGTGMTLLVLALCQSAAWADRLVEEDPGR